MEVSAQIISEFYELENRHKWKNKTDTKTDSWTEQSAQHKTKRTRQRRSDLDGGNG